jgi:hypothetical protein
LVKSSMMIVPAWAPAAQQLAIATASAVAHERASARILLGA